jgi:hypothetical protein
MKAGYDREAAIRGRPTANHTNPITWKGTSGYHRDGAGNARDKKRDAPNPLAHPAALSGQMQVARAGLVRNRFARPTR